MLGKATIDTNTYGRTKGKNGSYTTNDQYAGRELLTPDEVRLLDNRYALLFIRGERPILDLKYDILKHPNIRSTPDAGGAPYRHDLTPYRRADIDIDLGASRLDDFEILDMLEIPTDEDEGDNNGNEIDAVLGDAHAPEASEGASASDPHGAPAYTAS